MREAIRALESLQEVGVLSGVIESSEEATQIIGRLTCLTAELLLISQGEDYDDAAFCEEQS